MECDQVGNFAILEFVNFKSCLLLSKLLYVSLYFLFLQTGNMLRWMTTFCVAKHSYI